MRHTHFLHLAEVHSSSSVYYVVFYESHTFNSVDLTPKLTASCQFLLEDRYGTGSEL